MCVGEAAGFEMGVMRGKRRGKVRHLAQGYREIFGSGRDRVGNVSRRLSAGTSKVFPGRFVYPVSPAASVYSLGSPAGMRDETRPAESHHRCRGTDICKLQGDCDVY